MTRLLMRCLAMMTLTLSVHEPRAAAQSDTSLKFSIVVAKDFPADELSFGDLRRVYMGYAVNAGGTRIIPLAYKIRTPERMAFDRAVLGMDAGGVARYWIDRKIRGESGPPKAIDSADLLQRVVAKLPGAMGYVPPNDAHASVKVLTIHGMPATPFIARVFGPSLHGRRNEFQPFHALEPRVFGRVGRVPLIDWRAERRSVAQQAWSF